MRRLCFIVAVALVTAPLSLVVPAGATSCAAPEISVKPAQVVVGDEIEIRGRYWNEVCPEPETTGCWDGPDEEDRPIQAIELLLVNRDTKERYPLGVVDANDRMEFSLRVPVDVPPGWYVVKDEDDASYVSNATRFQVVRGDG